MKLQVRLELPRIVAKQLGGSCTQVGEPRKRNSADPKVSHAQPPWHEAADAKKAPAIVWGALRQVFPGRQTRSRRLPRLREFMPNGASVQGAAKPEEAVNRILGTVRHTR